MKKRKSVGKPNKGKINSSKKCKMNLREKEFLAITIFAFFVFSFLLAANTYQQNMTITSQVIKGIDIDAGGQIATFLTNIMEPANANETVVKWILFFTFALGIWGIISLIMGKKKRGGALKLLSFPLAYAMVYLLRIEEIFSGLIGYGALGMTILVILPFLAILFFSVRLLEGKVTALKTIIQLLVWYFYTGFLIYFIIRAAFSTESYSIGVLIIIGIGLLISIFAIIKNEPLRKWIAKLNREGIGKEIEDIQHAIGMEEKTKKRRIRELGEE